MDQTSLQDPAYHAAVADLQRQLATAAGHGDEGFSSLYALLDAAG